MPSLHSTLVRSAILVAAVAAVLGSEHRARADEAIPDTDWRRSERRYETPQSWAFELRFGAYKPNIDKEFSSGAKPFEQVFGNSGHFFFGAELDYQAVRIPWVGTLGPGAGWGYTHMSSKAKFTGTGLDSDEDTSFWVMPMYGAAVLRVDVLAREVSVPLVPFVKAGMGYGIWRASNELGTSNYQGTVGKGHAFGPHLAGGMALQLDFLDRHSAAQLDESVGINHSYAYFEWMWSDLGSMGSNAMKVGTSTWVTGLAFEI